MPVRASQFFSVMIRSHDLFTFYQYFFGAKPKLGRDFDTVYFAPLGNDVCYRFWLKLLGVQPTSVFI